MIRGIDHEAEHRKLWRFLAEPELVGSRHIVPCISKELADGLCEVLEETKEWSKKE